MKLSELKDLIREMLKETTIVNIAKGKDSGYARGAIGEYYKLELSNGKILDVSDEDFLERYEDLRSDDKPSFEELKSILIGRNWNDDLNEDNVTGGGEAYLTPKAFSKKGQKGNMATKTAKKQGMVPVNASKWNKVNKISMKESLQDMIKTELLKEVTYNKFRNEIKFRTKSETLHKAIKEVKRKLNEIDRIVEYTSRIKQELSEELEGIKYWKNSLKTIEQIGEILNHLNVKIKDLY